MYFAISSLLIAFFISAGTCCNSQLSGDEQSASENKRDIVYPVTGTKWCGAGRIAENYDDLGQQVEADKCCRAHDYCNPHIKPFQSAYGVFNFNLFTVMGCECNVQFAECLATAGTPTALQVKKWFFDVFKPVCLSITMQKVCIKRKLLRCIEYGYEEKGQLINM